jgi:uncharacterized membrane protein
MKDKIYSSINRYLFIIRDALATTIEDKAELEDILTELEEHILQKAVDFAESDTFSKEDISNAMKEFGDPKKIAQDYARIYIKERKSLKNVEKGHNFNHVLKKTLEHPGSSLVSWKIFIYIFSCLAFGGILLLFFLAMI